MERWYALEGEARPCLEVRTELLWVAEAVDNLRGCNRILYSLINASTELACTCDVGLQGGYDVRHILDPMSWNRTKTAT